jgi:hypothetical protein
MLVMPLDDGNFKQLVREEKGKNATMPPHMIAK